MTIKLNVTKSFTGIWITILVGINQLSAQCNYSTCTTLTKEINSAITINSPTTWETGTTPNDYTCTKVDAKVIVNSTLTINAVDLKMTTNGWFQINNGGTLTITNGTEIYAFSSMWGSTAGGGGPDGGIKVKGGGTLIVDGSTIAEAYLAINAVSDATYGEANLYLDESCFFNNQIGVLVGPYTGAMDSHIISCRFAAPSLISPLSGIGDFGIYLNQVKPTDPFLIGDNLQYQAVSAHNEFDNLDVGIMSYRSNAKIVDNLFHDLNIGVEATGTTSYNVDLFVGRLIDPLEDVHTLFNRFTNVITAIDVSNHVNTDIYSNWIESDYDVGAGEYIMERGVKIANSCPDINIEKNFISNFNQRGISIQHNPGAENVYIHFNTLVNYSPVDHIVSTGIFVSETTPGSIINLNIDGNAIFNVLTGIRVINVDEATLYYNLPTFQFLDGGGVAYGIRMSDCNYTIVGFNACTGNYASGIGFEDKVRGIYFEDCKYFVLSGNSVNTASEGIYITGTSDDGNIYCNRMTDCDIGVLLLDIGGSEFISPLADVIENPVDNGPAGNHWYDEYTANRVTTQGTTDCRNTDWLYYDDSDEYDIPLGLVSEIIPSYRPNFIWIEGVQCTAYPEMMEPGEVDYETYLAATEINFATWAAYYNHDEIEYSPHSWFKQYGFWRSIKDSGIAVGDLSDELQELYESVSTSNIPMFDSLANSFSKQDLDKALMYATNISPENDIEYYWKLTTQIYLSSLDTTSSLVLNDEDRSILRDIAALDGSWNGPGVYQAWVMLDTTIDKYREVYDQRKLVTLPMKVTIAPNPAQSFVWLNCDDVNYLSSNILSVELFDITGSKVKTFKDFQTTTLFVGDLANGLYLFKVQC